jgi:aspartyl/asparaginyl beta-hydroxylase (cupin superfamily)
LGSGTVRGRAINYLKKESNDEENPLNSIIHNNLLQHDRLCRKNDEKPTVYFHRGLSSGEIKLSDQEILIEHYDEFRQEIVKFFQENDNIQWTNFYLYKNGEENENNCKKLPKLYEILHLLPNAICINNPNCLFGNCFLTRLTSNNHKEDENPNGLTNCCIKMHFGLICDDQSSAYVLINKQKRLLIENKRVILYNDAIEHSIKNPNENQQVFLTIDFWHPDLSSEMRKQLTSIFHTDLA